MAGLGRSIRRPAVAGAFYAADPTQLRAQIEGAYVHRLGPGALPGATAERRRLLKGLVVPHAGYLYSAPTAAHAYAALARDGLPQLAVVIGPNHTGLGASASISPDYYRTPLGDPPIAADVARDLVEGPGPHLCCFDRDAHLQEHSVEVQVPFLQHLGALLGDEVAIVPIVLRAQERRSAVRLGQEVAHALEGSDAIVIASTDFCHYLPKEEAVRRDRFALERIACLDVDGLYASLAEHDISMCGYGPTAATMTATKLMGASSAQRLAYSTSGDIVEMDEVVGYGAFAIR